MAEQLPVVSYGTVVGRFLAAVADGTEDADLNPDGIPVTGSVTFTPSVSAILVDSSNPPVTILPTPITATLDAQGYLSLNGVRGIKLVATDSSYTNPTSFTYEVSFKNMRYAGGSNVNYPSYSIAVPTDSTTDLSLTAPVPTSTGNPVLRDEATVIDAANRAQRAADIATGIADEVIHGTYSGVGFQALTGVSQPLTNSAYSIIQFNTVVTDTVHAFDASTGLYTIPVSGMWDVAGTVRFNDASVPAGSNIGVGIAAQNGDLPGFSWQTAGAFRNTFQVARAIYFTAGDKVRLYVYHEVPGQVATQSATLSLSLVTAAAVPSASTPDVNDDHRLGGRVQPVTNGNANDLIQSGWYGGYNVSGAPSVDAYHFQVVRSQGDSNDGAGRVWQQARGYDGVNADVTFERTYRDAVWTAWVRVSNNLGAVDQTARDGLAPLNIGGRLGVAAKEIANADLNGYHAQGWYLGGSNAVNGVGFGRFVLQVSSAGDGYTHQRMLGITGDLVNNEWTRLTSGGPGSNGWSPWKQVADASGPIDATARATTGLTGRLGPLSKDISGTDLNVMRDNGYYAGSSLQNAPDNGFFYVHIQRNLDTSAYCHQIAAPAGRGPGYAGTVYQRFAEGGGGWSPWKQISDPAGALDPIARAAAAPLSTGNRLAKTGADVGNTSSTPVDGNGLTDQGWYIGVGIKNAPTGNFCYVQVQSHPDATWTLQTWTEYAKPDGSGIAAPRRWTRQKQSNVWQPYVLDSGDVQPSPGAPVQRDTDGNVRVALTPTMPNAATSREYVDAALAAAGGNSPVTSDSGTATIAIPAAGATLRRVLTGNATVTVPVATNAAQGYTVHLILKQDGTGNRTVTWPQAILWPGGNKPVLSTAANAIDHVRLMWDGTEWLGYPQGSAFGQTAVAPVTAFTDTFTGANGTRPKAAWVVSPAGVTIQSGRMAIAPGTTAWSSFNYVMLGTVDNTNGSTATGAPPVVADYETLHDYSLVSLAEQYPKIGVRVRPRTYNGNADDLWLDGDGGGLFKTGYTVVLGISTGKIEVYEGYSTELLDSKSGVVFPTKDMTLRTKVSGKGLYLKFWTKGAAEPTDWTYSNPTVLFNQSGGLPAYAAANNGDGSVSKTVSIGSFSMTTPVVTPGPSMNAPTQDPPGWERLFTEDFNTAAPAGTGANGFITKYANSFLPYNDEGMYWPRAMISAHDGYMDVYMDGTRGSAGTFGPASLAYDRVGGRFTMRAMATDAIGNGTAVIIWPTSEVWSEGELDYPESNFEDSPMVHHHSMTKGNEGSAQDGLTGVTWREWHTYTVEWVPGQYVRYLVDDVEVLNTSTDVPTTPHRFMFQVGNYGNPGHLLIDSVTISAIQDQ